jgi:uncharacterized protein YycO
MVVVLFTPGLAVASVPELSPVGEKMISANPRVGTAEVVSYIDIFQAHYNTVLEAVKAADKSDILNFEDFCNDYYDSGLSLPSYTKAVIRSYSVEEYLSEESLQISDFETLSSASSDANYILSSTNHGTTPASDFVYVPAYNMFNYSLLQAGDIIHESQTILNNIGHTAMIFNISKSGAYGNYIQTIESVSGGVQFGFLDDTRMVNFGVVVLRVYGVTTSIISKAKTFCLAQLGKPYNALRAATGGRNSGAIDSPNWYCSEMIYSAYLHAGIDLFDANLTAPQTCFPIEIYNCARTQTKMTADHNCYLGIAIVSKSGIKWTIKISNKTTSNVQIQYNSKMCFKADAQGWKNLRHIVTINIPAQGSVNVEISENLFADAIVVSRAHPVTTQSLITYGYNLNKNNKTMTVEYQVK